LEKAAENDKIIQTQYQESTVKHKIFPSFILLVFLSLACNAPTGDQFANTTEPKASEIVPAPTELAVTEVVPTKVPPPVDITFSINCDAIDASFLAYCDEYIAVTAEVVYPILREITGVGLADCFDRINYTIIPGDAADGAGGISNGSEITYSKTYSIDLVHKYDVHELIHSMSACSGALDQHVFHGILQNTVYERLNVLDAGYFESRENAVDLNNYLLEAVKTSNANDLHDQCRGILANSVTIAYFDIDDENAVTTLYRATINPQPAAALNEKLTAIWGDSANQVQTLLDTLEQNYKYLIDAPECGY
jgi:hypothetical protein